MSRPLCRLSSRPQRIRSSHPYSVTLPPAYAYTKAFKFGLVFETTDDTTADEIKK